MPTNKQTAALGSPPCVRVCDQEDFRHAQVSDVRSQLRFLEQLEGLEKQRRDEEERDQLLRIARVTAPPPLPRRIPTP